MLLTASSITQLPNIAFQIISLAENNRIFLFYGDMGAGKTTLIKTLCKQLGSEDNITSPTFSIVNEYKAKKKQYLPFRFLPVKEPNRGIRYGS